MTCCSLLEPPHAGERDGYFKMRLAGLLEDTNGETPDEIDPEIRRVTEMGLGDLDMFIEILMALRGPIIAGTSPNSLTQSSSEAKPASCTSRSAARDALPWEASCSRSFSKLACFDRRRRASTLENFV